MRSLLKDTLVTRVMNAVAAGTSEQKSTVLDMQGFDSVMFVLLLGDVTIADVLTLTAKSNPTSSTTGGTSEGAVAAQTDPDGTSEDNKVVVLDILRPTQRYIFADITRITANAAIDGVLAIQYNAKSMPQTQGSTVLASALAGPNA